MTAADQSTVAEHLIEEGLFVIDETGTPRLLGTKCPSCGTVFGGRRSVCLACFHVGLESRNLGPNGTIHSFTTVQQQSPDALIAPPYVVVQVTLTERVIVTAPLLDADPQKIAIGLPVRTKAVHLKDHSGDPLLSYGFVLA